MEPKPTRDIVFEWGTLGETKEINHLDLATKVGKKMVVMFDRPLRLKAGEQVQVTIRVNENGNIPTLNKIVALAKKVVGIAPGITPGLEIEFKVWVSGQKQKIHHRYGKLQVRP